MDRRRKLLIAALAVIAIAFFGEQFYRTWYEQPLEKAQRSIATLENRLHESNLSVRRQQNRLPDLDSLQQQSLPRNAEIAVTEYRAWLFQLIADCGLQPPNLNSSAPGRFRDLYARIDFSVRSRGTLSQLTQFLHEFYGTEYLHKIRSLSLTPTSDGTLDISMNIETLSVPLVALDDTLPKPQQDPQLTGLTSYQSIAQRNMFRAGQPPASLIKLSAITRDRQQIRKAWLNFQTNGQTQIVSEGEQLTIDGTQLEIRQIRQRDIQVAIDGSTPHRVAIGESLQ